MVDQAVLAAKVAAVRDAVERIRDVLPPIADDLRHDRTAREVVTLNLFVALQECLALAAHWLADERWIVPGTYGDVFLALAEHGVLDRELAGRLVAAAGLRNLIAHQYGVLDANRLHATASKDLNDLVEFCAVLVSRTRAESK